MRSDRGEGRTLPILSLRVQVGIWSNSRVWGRKLRKPEGVQVEAHAAPPPPVKRPHPARRPGSVYTPDIHLPPRASEREAERERLRESWRGQAPARSGEGRPEAGGRDGRWQRGESRPAKGRKDPVWSRAPPSVGSSAPTVNTPGHGTRSLHSPPP